MSPAAALLWAMSFSTERSLQAAVGGRFETMVGVVPDNTFEGAEASVALVAIPVAGVQVNADRTEFALLYRPRIYWRFPNPMDLSRPLLLHQAALEHQYLLSERTTWLNRAYGSIGEIDYALSSLVFDPSQPSVPTDDVTDLVRFGGTTGIAHQLTRRASTGFALSGNYNSPLDTSEESVFIRSADGQVAPYYGYRVTTRDSLTLEASVGYAWFDEEATYLTVMPTLTLGHDFTEQTNGGIGAGVAYLRVMDAIDPEGPVEGETEVSPTGEAHLTTDVYSERGRHVNAGVMAQYQWYFDPVVGRPVQRAGGGVFGTLMLLPDWTMGAAVSFYTTVGESTFETEEEETVVRTDQTMLRIDAPVSYDINRLLGLEFGVRSNLRGPALSDGVEVSEVELWLYGALRLVFDPKDKQAGWNR